jgi:class 3 adenylate cyclase
MEEEAGPSQFRLARALRATLERSVGIAEPFIVAAGALGLIGHPLFYLIWVYVFPQPYEDLALRLLGSALCLPLLLQRRWPERLHPFRAAWWVLAVFYNLPLLFPYFLLRNGLSEVWVLSLMGGAFLLTFLVELLTALVLFVLGTGLAYWAYAMGAEASVPLAEYLEFLVIALFPLTFGGVVNYQLQRYRTLQSNFERRLRHITTQNARLVQEQNQLLSRFLSNVLVARLRKFQAQFGLEEALAMVTRQEVRFCGIMQADVRNFTKMFGRDSEIDVARLIHRSFAEITEIGQDLAVIKPVGDSIFMYSDDEHGRQNAVFNILSLAVFFVSSLEAINKLLGASRGFQLNFGIAIHAGEAIYGNLASDTLIDPTIIGINANKAARLEELTKIKEVQQQVGANAIIFSEEVAFYSSNYIRGEDLISIDLDATGVVLRDFPEVKRVFALPSAAVAAYYDRAMTHIQSQRSRLSLGASTPESYAHHGVPYFYEMQGAGPDTHWLAMIDVTTLPPRVVSQYAATALGDLEYEINQADGLWLILSTRRDPGEFDEHDMEKRIHRIIEDLERQAARVVG